VGWDSDWINLAELREEWAEDIVGGQLTGLVVTRNMRSQLPNSVHFVPFDDDHDWIPYLDSQDVE
jgi:hypothetical protein